MGLAGSPGIPGFDVFDDDIGDHDDIMAVMMMIGLARSPGIFQSDAIFGFFDDGDVIPVIRVAT